MTDEGYVLPSGSRIHRMKRVGKMESEAYMVTDPNNHAHIETSADLWEVAALCEMQNAMIRVQAQRIVELEHLTDCFCDKPEDRMWHGMLRIELGGNVKGIG